MKITIEDTEVGKIIATVLATKFGGEWECTSETYRMNDLDFVQVTPEYLAEKEAKAQRMAAIQAKWEAEEAAKAVVTEEKPF